MLFTQIHQVLTCCHICCIILWVHVCIHANIHIHCLHFPFPLGISCIYMKISAPLTMKTAIPMTSPVGSGLTLLQHDIILTNFMS